MFGLLPQDEILKDFLEDPKIIKAA